jgi:FixJ family two-component response regulator
MSAEKINVAVVDDDGSFCRALGRLLRAAGFAPVMYPSAEAFLQDATRTGMDCLVLDIHLGGMSGFDLQKHLAETGSPPPIIFMTGHEEPETPELARRAGCVAFLRKPFVGSSLLDAIRRAVEARPSAE